MAMLAFCASVEGQGMSPTNNRLLHLNVVFSDRGMVGEQQRWMEMLSGVGADRVTSETSMVEEPTVTETGDDDPLMTVTGIVKGPKLLLPGGKFSIRQSGAISSHLNQLKTDGAKFTLSEKMAFGLPPEELVGLHDQLSRPVATGVKDRPGPEVIQELLTSTGMPSLIDPSAAELMQFPDPVLDEVQGLSVGTALAAVARPMGMVIEPKRENGRATLVARDSRGGTESWPIGWPLREPPVAVAPELFTKIDLAVEEISLQQVITAFGGRLSMPILLDHNSLARAGVDLAEVKVTYRKNKTSYAVAMSSMLAQSRPKLKYELRVDEAGKVFIWISPM